MKLQNSLLSEYLTRKSLDAINCCLNKTLRRVNIDACIN